ncbi:MAG: hypothetical protein QNJ90_13425 [Planctomycetota bacterium]|nr:hypothetical protein [Planctomycetota bacterium]
MNLRQLAPAVLFVVAVVALVWLAWPGQKPIPLVEVLDGPRPPVSADGRTRPLVLRGLTELFPGGGNVLRRERNELAERHRKAVASWRAGKLSLREVEGLEQMLWVARHKVGELPEQEMHARLAELFGREARRLEILAEKGMAGEHDLALARLYTARERHLAGMQIEDAKGRDYATMREQFLTGTERRNRLLLESGMGSKEHMELEWEALQKDFPEP